MQFPVSAIEILRKARWNPNAVRNYEILSGGFFWTDENLQEVASICTSQNCYIFREIIAYRASLVRDEPRNEFKQSWEMFQRDCPDWPGFRPERSSHQLLVELEEAHQVAMDSIEALMD